MPQLNILQMLERAQILAQATFAQRHLLNLTLEIFLVYLSFVLLGFFFLFFLKPNLLLIGESMRRSYMPAVISGALGIVFTPVIFLALLGTLIGIFLLPAFVFVYVLFLLLAFYSAALLIGEFIARIFTFRDHIYLELFLGATILFFGLFIPYIGVLFFAFFMLLGMGGVINMRFGTRQ